MNRKNVITMVLASLMVTAVPMYSAIEAEAKSERSAVAIKAEAKPERSAVAVKAEAKPERAKTDTNLISMAPNKPDTNEPDMPEVPFV
jgi:hypothetical protein